MPYQNRVNPFGEIVAIPERGTLMGIRGILHDADGQIRRRWAGRAWISCHLEFRGRRATVMAPGHYTHLFFLDEPTALRPDTGRVPTADAPTTWRSETAWARANAQLGLGARPRAAEIDRVLHAERLGPSKGKRLHPAELASLPDGVMVTFGQAASGEAYLIWRGRLWRWSPAATSRLSGSRPTRCSHSRRRPSLRRWQPATRLCRRPASSYPTMRRAPVRRSALGRIRARSQARVGAIARLVALSAASTSP